MCSLSPTWCHCLRLWLRITKEKNLFIFRDTLCFCIRVSSSSSGRPASKRYFKYLLEPLRFFFVGKNSRHCRNSSGSTFCLAEMATKDKEIYGYRFERYNKSIGTCSFIAHRRCARRVSIMTSDKTKP